MPFPVGSTSTGGCRWRSPVPLEDATPAVHGSIELTSNAALASKPGPTCEAQGLLAVDSGRSRSGRVTRSRLRITRGPCGSLPPWWFAPPAKAKTDGVRPASLLSTHKLVHGLRGAGYTYLCSGCGGPTTRCASPSCDNFANRGISPITKPKYCAEHRHEIPSFEDLTSSVAGPRGVVQLAGIQEAQPFPSNQDGGRGSDHRGGGDARGLGRSTRYRWSPGWHHRGQRCGGHRPRARHARRWLHRFRWVRDGGRNGRGLRRRWCARRRVGWVGRLRLRQRGI